MSYRILKSIIDQNYFVPKWYAIDGIDFVSFEDAVNWLKNLQDSASPHDCTQYMIVVEQKQYILAEDNERIKLFEVHGKYCIRQEKSTKLVDLSTDV